MHRSNAVMDFTVQSLTPLGLLCDYTETSEIYTLSLHDALPICAGGRGCWARSMLSNCRAWCRRCKAKLARWEPLAGTAVAQDRKSTRLNSSHVAISYAVFCLKKNKTM